jgi:hypothetical protein
LAAVVGCVLSFAAQAATLSAGSATAKAGWDDAAVPVELDAAEGESVAAIQFDMTYENTKLSVVDVLNGAASEAAAKQLSFSSVDSDTIRVVIAGLNLNVISDGVVAEVVLSTPLGASGGETPLTVSGVFLSDPSGNAIPATAESGSVYIEIGLMPLVGRLARVMLLALLGAATVRALKRCMPATSEQQ